MKKIVHIIPGLGNGGAEILLERLLSNLDKTKYKLEVISLIDEGILGEKIKKMGINIHSLHMKRGKIDFQKLFKGLKICKDCDIIQGWLYHGNLFAFICGKILGKKIIWGIHHANFDKDKHKKLTLLIIKIMSFLSRFVDVIVCGSKVVEKLHKEIGYNGKMLIIQNGFELDKFYKIEKARLIIEKELGLEKDIILFGSVGRYDLQKDYLNCFEAMRIIKNKKIKFKLLLIGPDLTNENIELKKMIEKTGIEENVMLLGKREDIPLLMSSLDIYVSSSVGEGFSNVIGEAMACETICVITDTGIAEELEDRSLVVPIKDAKMLAEKCIEVIRYSEAKKEEIRKKGRREIFEKYEIKKIVKKYEDLYKI